jgi:hypothetical protein
LLWYEENFPLICGVAVFLSKSDHSALAYIMLITATVDGDVADLLPYSEPRSGSKQPKSPEPWILLIYFPGQAITKPGVSQIET